LSVIGCQLSAAPLRERRTISKRIAASVVALTTDQLTTDNAPQAQMNRTLLHFRALAFSTAGGGGPMKTWEYKIINVRSENYSMDPRRAEELNRLGDDGWELVSITSINFKTGATDHIGMVFKREKQQHPA
jgi:hypothetical protein